MADKYKQFDARQNICLIRSRAALYSELLKEIVFLELLAI